MTHKFVIDCLIDGFTPYLEDKEMTNTNCLAGWKCPECGSEESFRVEATSIFTVLDDGTDSYEDVEWNDQAYAQCKACDHEGMVKDFDTE